MTSFVPETFGCAVQCLLTQDFVPAIFDYENKIERSLVKKEYICCCVLELHKVLAFNNGLFTVPIRAVEFIISGDFIGFSKVNCPTASRKQPIRLFVEMQ